MLVSGIVKTSLVDYPGKISCVLFVPGCNFDCFFCHNRSLIEGRKKPIYEKHLFNFLYERKDFLEGVVISGGEPTLQKDLEYFAHEVKSMGYKMKLDTNGSFPEEIDKFIRKGLFDYYAVDYKAPKKMYKSVCGKSASPEKVLETIALLSESGSKFQVRTTILPLLGENDLMEMASELPELPKYVLNKYIKPKEYPETKIDLVQQRPYTEDQIRDLADKVSHIQPNAKFM